MKAIDYLREHGRGTSKQIIDAVGAENWLIVWEELVRAEARGLVRVNVKYDELGGKQARWTEWEFTGG